MQLRASMTADWLTLPAWRLAGPGALFEHLRHQLLRERDRWFLWLPVGFATGIACYFGQSSRPSDAAVTAAAVAALAAGLLAWRIYGGQGLLHATFLGLAVIAAGFALAGYRVERLAAPVVAKPATWTVVGRIIETAPAVRGQRLVLDRLVLEKPRADIVPERVRVTLRQGGEDLRVGDVVRLRARLSPPSPPVLPGSFDFARHAWLDRLGGIGYAFGKPEVLARDPSDPAAMFTADLRDKITRRIVEVAPGETGAIAAALVAGLRAGISDETWRAMQVSGLAHLLSISGVHMALAAGTIFMAVRYAAALIPPLVLRVPAKKVAAVAAAFGALFYLLISGASVPAQRSFIMVAVGLLAILVNRNPISMRVLAWAALAVLIPAPESVVGISFQLSFAAVAALVATYETGFGLLKRSRESGLFDRARVYVLGLIVTSAIATIATSPFTAMHFQTIATYSIPANLVAAPITGLIIMPAALMSLLLMPAGLDALPIELMAFGVDLMVGTAYLFADLPGASVSVVQWPHNVLLFVAAGGVWLALWRTPWRFFGLVPIAVGLLVGIFSSPPDLLVDRRLDMALWREANGTVRLATWRRDGWTLDGWLRAMAAEETVPWPAAGSGAQGDVACDSKGCVIEAQGVRIALGRDPGAAATDCEKADLVISRMSLERCTSGHRAIGSRSLWRSGGIALWLKGGVIELATVEEGRGVWPWTEGGRSKTD